MQKKLNILYIHEVSYMKKPIFEMHEFPEHLAARGHKVTFLQFDEGFKFWQGNRQPRTKTISGRVLPETKINLVTPHQFGIPGLDRIYATLSVWPELVRLLKNEKFDAIVLYAALLRTGANFLPVELSASADAWPSPSTASGLMMSAGVKLAIVDDDAALEKVAVKPLSLLLANWCHADPVLATEDAL